MTAMLASVSSLAEAKLVADCADVIDLKDAHAGALGAVTLERVRDVVRWSAGRFTLSAALGDLPMRPNAIAAAASAMACTGVDAVKIGLFDVRGSAACMRAAATGAGRARLVAVMFADRSPDLALLDEVAAARFAGAMLDTADKRSGTLLDCLGVPALRAFVARGHALGLFVGLAGSLHADDVATLLPCDPDFLGFRGAICARHARTGRVSRRRAQALAARFAGRDLRKSPIDRLRARRDARAGFAEATAVVSA